MVDRELIPAFGGMHASVLTHLDLCHPSAGIEPVLYFRLASKRIQGPSAALDHLSTQLLEIALPLLDIVALSDPFVVVGDFPLLTAGQFVFPRSGAEVGSISFGLSEILPEIAAADSSFEYWRSGSSRVFQRCQRRIGRHRIADVVLGRVDHFISLRRLSNCTCGIVDGSGRQGSAMRHYDDSGDRVGGDVS